MIDGHDFIRLAGKLCVLAGGDESSFRTTISRAYYGVFHLAKRFLEELGFSIVANENAHGFLRKHLLNCGHPIALGAGRILVDLHKNRIRADYDLEDQRLESADFARRNVENAHDFERMLTTCREEPARSEIQTGIADYQSKLR